MQPKVVITTTIWWPHTARLAAALANSGAYVGAICPDGSPLRSVNGVRELFRYPAIRPKRSLAAALRAIRPDLVIPCDERAVAHLHAIHCHELCRSGTDGDSLRRLIERSLGAPQEYRNTLDRGAALALATQEGIRVPATRILSSEVDLRAWCTERAWPALLKTDCSWGGKGVTLVDGPASAARAFRRMSRPIPTWRMAKFLLSNRDPFPLGEWLIRKRSRVIGQDFVQGRPANVMVACWEGEVLATIGVKVLDTLEQFGAATMVQVVKHDGMESAAKRLVRRLGLSGFCGLDFIMEQGTGDVHLIELNPRATQLGHLELGPEGSLALTLLMRLRGEPLPAASPLPYSGKVIALFPQAWLSRSAASWLPSACHDIPWEENALVEELLRRPWDRRSPLARLIDLLLHKPDPRRLLAASFGKERSSRLA